MSFKIFKGSYAINLKIGKNTDNILILAHFENSVAINFSVTFLNPKKIL
jgi:hypothetical protein